MGVDPQTVDYQLVLTLVMMDDDSVPFSPYPGPSSDHDRREDRSPVNNNPEIINILMTLSDQMAIACGKLDRLEAQMKTAMHKLSEVEGVLRSLKISEGGGGAMRSTHNRSSRK